MRGPRLECMCVHQLLCIVGRAEMRVWQPKWPQESGQLHGLQLEEPRFLLLPGQVLWQLFIILPPYHYDTIYYTQILSYSNHIANKFPHFIQYTTPTIICGVHGTIIHRVGMLTRKEYFAIYITTGNISVITYIRIGALTKYILFPSRHVSRDGIGCAWIKGAQIGEHLVDDFFVTMTSHCPTNVGRTYCLYSRFIFRAHIIIPQCIIIIVVARK